MGYISRVIMKNRIQIRVSTDDILARMAKKNMSRLDLAKAISSSSGYVSQIINGDVQPGPDLRSRILGALGCRFDDVFFLRGVGTKVQYGKPCGKQAEDN